MGSDQSRIDGFREAAQSLKAYRRADIPDRAGGSLVDKLYVDPLPNDHVLDQILRPNTTFVIGRKGTGKSTIFLRAQHQLDASTTAVSAYVDIKTVYESCEVDRKQRKQLGQLRGSLGAAKLEQIQLTGEVIQ